MCWRRKVNPGKLNSLDEQTCLQTHYLLDEETDNVSIMDKPSDEQGPLGNVKVQIHMPSLKISDLRVSIAVFV